MPKTSELCAATREKIVLLKNQQKTYRQIADFLGLNFSTVRYVIKRYEERGSTENSERKGRPKKLTPRLKRKIRKEALKNPVISSRELAAMVQSTSGVQVTSRTIRYALNSEGLHGRVPRKKPYISETNRKKRLAFAREYVQKPLSFWENVVFSDESKFNLFGSDGRRTIWRHRNEALKKQNVLTTVKHGGGHVMVWGCVFYHGVGNLVRIEGNLNAEGYVNILRRNLRVSVEKMGIQDQYYFQQDNDPKHTARRTKEWLIFNVPRQLHTPPQSPDINIIENLRHALDQNVRKHHITSGHHLIQLLVQEWEQIHLYLIKNLVHSMPRRLQAIIDANGLFTKY